MSLKRIGLQGSKKESQQAHQLINQGMKRNSSVLPCKVEEVFSSLFFNLFLKNWVIDSQEKKKHQEVNNELVKSNIRAQKALQEAEKMQREMEQRVSRLEKQVAQHETRSEKINNEREQANVRSFSRGENSRDSLLIHRKTILPHKI